MKNYFKHVMLLALVLMASQGAFAQKNDGTSMQDIYEMGLEIIKMVEDKYDKEIVHIEYDIIRESKDITRYLSSGYEYSIVAFADDRVEDLDVVIYKKSGGRWVEVAKDTDSSSVSVASVTPKTEGEYKFEVKVYKYASGYSACHYGLMIYHE